LHPIFKQDEEKEQVVFVSERIDKIGVSPTMKVAAKAKEMQSEGLPVIDLSVGEPDFPTPQNIKDAAKRAIDENQTYYTINAGTVKLRKAIAAKLKSENNLEYSHENIIVSCGVKHSLYNAIQTIVNKDDEVILPAPYWVSYPEMISVADGKTVVIDTTQENGFKVTPEQLKKAITQKTKAFILCNPSNPTGSTYTRKELEAIAEIALENNFYVITDEIYEKLIYDDFEFISFPTLHPDLMKKTILVNGISKAYSMTGWRIGYTAAPENVIKGMNKLQSHSTSNASSISQAAAIEALTGPQDQVEYMRKEFEKRRNYFHKELSKIPEFSCNLPEGAFFLFPNVEKVFHHSTEVLKVESSFDFAMYLLYEAKIAVVPGSAFGAEGFIRLSYATSMENLEEAVKRINKAMEKLR